MVLALFVLLHCANDAIRGGIGSVGWGRFRFQLFVADQLLDFFLYYTQTRIGIQKKVFSCCGQIVFR